MGTSARRVPRGIVFGLISLLCLVTLTPGPVRADTNLLPGERARIAYANGESVRLRAGVGFDSEVVTLLPEGTQVQLLDGPLTAADGTLWYQLMVGEQTGYIVHEFLAADGAPEPAMSDPAVELEPALEPEPAVALAPDPALVPTGTIVKTLGEGARCRIDATYSAGVITVLAEGAIVELGDVAADGWHAVVCEGQTGYVHLDYLLIDGAPPVEPAPDLDPIPETDTALLVTAEATASVAATVPAPLPSLAATKPPPPTLDATLTVEATPVDTAPAVTADGTLTGMATVSGTNGEGLRCRSGASYSATTITVLPEGDKVGVTGAAVGEWQPVACGGLNGYVHTDFITIAESAAAPAGARLAVTEDETFTAAAVTGMAKVSGTDGGGLRCRSAASYSGMTITMLAEGSSVSLRGGLTGEWQA
ncbi:MAG: SH3 domain-containing protein, partial [Chloroflexia bacterium]|nr:SH3 domain-containing protein [Chloroflexia bacterium]